MNIRKKRRARSLEHGDRIRVSGHAGGDHDEGGTFELHGETGTVVGANPHYRNAKGEHMVAVELDDSGAIVTVPRRAMKRD